MSLQKIEQSSVCVCIYNSLLPKLLIYSKLVGQHPVYGNLDHVFQTSFNIKFTLLSILVLKYSFLQYSECQSQSYPDCLLLGSVSQSALRAVSSSMFFLAVCREEKHKKVFIHHVSILGTVLISLCKIFIMPFKIFRIKKQIQVKMYILTMWLIQTQSFPTEN